MTFQDILLTSIWIGLWSVLFSHAVFITNILPFCSQSGKHILYKSQTVFRLPNTSARAVHVISHWVVVGGDTARRLCAPSDLPLASLPHGSRPRARGKETEGRAYWGHLLAPQQLGRRQHPLSPSSRRKSEPSFGMAAWIKTDRITSLWDGESDSLVVQSMT